MKFEERINSLINENMMVDPKEAYRKIVDGIDDFKVLLKTEDLLPEEIKAIKKFIKAYEEFRKTMRM